MLLPCIQLIDTTWGNSNKEEKVNKHSKLEEREKDKLSAATCKPIGNTKDSQGDLLTQQCIHKFPSSDVASVQEKEISSNVWAEGSIVIFLKDIPFLT